MARLAPGGTLLLGLQGFLRTHHLLGRGVHLAARPSRGELGALLAEQGLGPADLERALARLEATEGTAVRAVVGINEDGVFGTSREGWRPELPDACREPFIPLLWVKVHELLGRVPAGSTARFIRDGMLPAELAVYRLAS